MSFEFAFDQNSKVYSAKLQLDVENIDENQPIQDNFDLQFVIFLKKLDLGDSFAREYLKSKKKRIFFNAFMKTLSILCNRKIEKKQLFMSKKDTMRKIYINDFLVSDKKVLVKADSKYLLCLNF
jgi:hypothetical protein